MKHLKEYNNWVTNTTSPDNIEINYGDKPKISDTIKSIIDYIDNKEYTLFHSNDYELTFKNTPINDLYRIVYDRYGLDIYINNEHKEKIHHHITDNEKKYLDEYFRKLELEDKLKKNKSDKILDITDPTRKIAKKYNI